MQTLNKKSCPLPRLSFYLVDLRAEFVLATDCKRIRIIWFDNPCVMEAIQTLTRYRHCRTACGAPEFANKAGQAASPQIRFSYVPNIDCIEYY